MKKLLLVLSTTLLLLTSKETFSQCAPDVTPPNAVCQFLNLYLDAAGTATLTSAQFDGGSSDGCGGVSFSVPAPSVFTCANIGANTVSMTVTDGSGNMSTCMATVTVIDTIAPVAVCQNITVNLDATGNATIVGADLDNGSSDGCGGLTPASFSASITSFTCADIGTNNVMLYVTDGSGNIDSCMAVVTIADTSAPTAICQPATVYLDAFGNVTIDSSDIDNGSSDVCSSVTMSVSTSTFTCDSIGPRTVFLYVTDSSGNSDTCSTTVTILDTVSPFLFGTNATVYLDANGGIRIDSSDINTTSSDNCGIRTIALSQDTFSCADAPIATVTMTVTDSSGNSTAADFSVFIIDTIAPVAMCQDTTVYLNAAGTITIDTSYINNGSSDNCDFINTLSASTFDCSMTGANMVTMYSTDASGNIDSCMSTVTVLDTITPIAICQAAPVAFLDSMGNLTIDSSVIDNGSSDNCDFTITLSASTFTCADIGDTVISIYVTDASGNSDTCSTTLTIEDNIAPIIVCQDTTVYLDANGGIRIDSSYIDNGTADNCFVQTLTLSLDTFSCANVGANVVTMTATDSAGNSSTCMATVTVLDTTAPTVLCQDTTVYLDAAGNIIIDTSYTNNGSSDNCDFVLTLSNNTFTCTDTGANTITMYGTDASGNVDSCTTIVTVLDTIAPILSTQPATVYLDSMGNVTILDSDVVLSVAEACPDTVIVNPRTFGCDSIGARTVEVIAIDQSGNSDTMSAIVTVVDSILPDAMCQDTTVYLDANGGIRIDSSYIENGSWDNCSIETITLSQDTFSCVDAGAVMVTMTVTDSSGNSSTCMATVTVLDTISPVALCQDTMIFLDATGNFTINTTFVDNGSSDNCTFTDSLSTTTFTCSDTGANTVTLYIIDASGNIDSCTSIVTVVDNILPTAICMDTTVYLTDSGTVIIDSSFVDGGFSDNCTFTAALSDTLFDCSDFGPNLITIILTDASGNTSSCTATVTVVDSVPPVAICKDTTIYLDASGTATIFPIDVNNGTYDNCFSANINTNATMFTCDSIGPRNVYLIATDPSGNTDTCISIVTVVDTFGPTAVCMDTTIYLDATGSFTIDSSFIDNGSSDFCSSVTMSLSTTVFTCDSIGVRMVTLTVTDTSGNMDSCTAMVTVLDTITPTAICKDTTIYLGAGSTIIIDSTFVDDGSSDNCTTTMTLSQNTFTCADTGSNLVTLTVTDASGNTASCTSTVTILDTVPPMAMCKNATVFLDSMGNASIGISDINDASSDNCAIDTMYVSQDTFTCADLGTNSVTLTVVDVNGNIDSCTGIVTVYDLITPFISCKDDTLYLGATGSDTVVAMDLVDSVWDNCSFTVTASPTAFNCSNIGVNPVRVSVTDADGRSSDCYSNLTVLDTMTPTVVCNSPTVYLNAAGVATITAADIDNGSSDNCAISTMTISTSSFDCTNIGANSVTLIVTDASGNIDSCISTVTVADTTAPIASCQNVTVFLDSMGTVTIDSSDVDNGSTDNCGIATIAVSPSSFTCANVGANTVTMTVTDVNGNVSTCTSVVTVLDNINPTAICMDDTVYLDATGNVSITTANVDGGSSDNCTFTMSLSDSAFTCADAGVNAVTLTVTDASGNSSFCNANVTVLDTTAPMAMCQDTTVYLNSIGNVTINTLYVNNGSSDNCAIDSMTISQSYFDCTNTGANTVTLTVTDESGNVSTCTSTVTVLDTTAPIARCQNASVFLDSMGNATIDSSYVDNGSTDNCDIATISISASSFDCTNIGPNMITMIVTDASGNIDSCISTVTVIDNLSPTAICKDDTVYLDATGNVIISATNIDGGSIDNCSPISMTISDSLFTCTDTGANTVTLYVSDASGNISLCTSTVKVVDTVLPTPVCNSPTVYLDMFGNASITVADIDGGSTDNCSIASMTISNSTFNCSNLGANSVTLIVTDVSGNVDSCIATVTVLDTIAPIANCKSATIYLNASGTAVLTSLDIDNGSTDNCNFMTFTLSRTIFTCSEVGPNNVTLVVTDGSGNVDSCVAVVTVLDTLPPAAVCQNITIQLDSNGSATIVALDVDGGSTDNCGIASLVVDKTTFDCSNLGPNTVTLTVTDIYGNSSTCTSIVTVEDLISPIAFCPGDKQRILRNTTCSYIVEDFIGETSSWDNCSLDDVTITQTPVAGTEVILENASQTITITATDGSGNSSTCTFDVYARCVKELNIPQFISPDGNGINDTWEIPELANYPNNLVKVFNRWGNLVMEQKGYYTGWDGRPNTNNGVNQLLDNKMLPEGTYFYIIDLGDGATIEPYTGYIQLKR